MDKNKKNTAMSAILNKAKDTSNKSYEQEDKKAVVKPEPVEKKSKGKAGRKKVDDKKKPRQVYLNDAEFKVIENIANDEMIDTKTLLLKAVKKYVKDTQGKTLEDLIKENEEEE